MQNELTEAEFTDSAALGASIDVSESPLVVMKFGGSSVSTPENWATIADLLHARLHDGLKPVVVLSALRNVSTMLEHIVSMASIRCVDDELAALIKIHCDIAEKLNLVGAELFRETITHLKILFAEALETESLTPRIRASALACGELLASQIGSAYLRGRGLNVQNEDARRLFTARSKGNRTDAQNYLSATCNYEFDPALSSRVRSTNGIMLTQGYIASNELGETVLLGREGSDTSAAYLAATIKARRVEIWTDVPGIFSADPRLEPSARLLHELHFDEAQELASTGSRVLHPRCIPPLLADAIPLFIRCTAAPHLLGTVISSVTRSPEPQVKAISVRKGVTLISMEGSSMWQEVGFLAQVFRAFEQHGVSVDLVSTSETSVVVSIDTVDGILSESQLELLAADLQRLCNVRIIERCAVITLVGRRIRAILSQLASAFTIFEEEKIHLVSQAANDLNFSFVIDEEQVPRILGKLHSTVIGGASGGDVFGAAWNGSYGTDSVPVMAESPWWMRKKAELINLAGQQICAYVYDADTVRASATSMVGMSSVDRLLYAVKANFNPELIRILASEGIDFDCVSPAEVEHVRAVVPGLADDRILLTLNFAPRSEYEWAIQEGIQLTLDNLYPLQAWPKIFDNQKLFIRLDPGQGYGHHEHVKTAGAQSKFGIPKFEIDELSRLVRDANATVIGIHAHSGSGILDPAAWRLVANELVEVAQRFPDAKVLDLGGGLGVPEKSGDPAFDLEALDGLLSSFKSDHPGYELWLEPGRYLVAGAGILLTRVTQTKGKGNKRYVGVGAGMNSMIRPALYGAYHEIVNLSRIDEPATLSATVVGPICETGDKLGSDRMLPECQEDDVMLVANAGAYGYVMGSRYNLRDIAPEIVLQESSTTKRD